MLMLYLF